MFWNNENIASNPQGYFDSLLTSYDNRKNDFLSTFLNIRMTSGSINIRNSVFDKF